MSRFVNGILIYTDKGVYLICLKGRMKKVWTKEECFKYCNRPDKDEFENKVRANKLTLKASLINTNNLKESDWYRHKENFKEVSLTIDFNGRG